jgi:cell division protein FtsB
MHSIKNKKHRRMKVSLPALGLVLASFIAAFVVVNDGSYQDLLAMRQSYSGHQLKNSQYETEVMKLRRKLHNLQHDDRYLEKVVREELLYARPNELVVLFEEH